MNHNDKNQPKNTTQNDKFSAGRGHHDDKTHTDTHVSDTKDTQKTDKTARPATQRPSHDSTSTPRRPGR